MGKSWQLEDEAEKREDAPPTVAIAAVKRPE